jgi:hypothetical protein
LATKKNGPGFRGQFPLLVALLVILILVATALLARNHTAIVALNGSGHHPAVSPWANGYAARANADSGVSITSVAVAIIAITPELNIDLGHLEVLGLGRNAADKQRGWHQHRSGQRRGKSNLCHGLLLGLIQTERVSRFISVSLVYSIRRTKPAFLHGEQRSVAQAIFSWPSRSDMGQSPRMHKNKLSRAADVPENFVRAVNKGFASGRWNLEPRRKVEASQWEL